MSEDGLYRMTGAELRDFVEHQMQMSANYQPVIIKNLICADGGRLAAHALARALVLEDSSQVARSRMILLRIPGLSRSPAISQYARLRSANMTDIRGPDVRLQCHGADTRSRSVPW